MPPSIENPEFGLTVEPAKNNEINVANETGKLVLEEVYKDSLFNSKNLLFWNGIGIWLVPFSWKYSLELR